MTNMVLRNKKVLLDPARARSKRSRRDLQNGFGRRMCDTFKSAQSRKKRSIVENGRKKLKKVRFQIKSEVTTDKAFKGASYDSDADVEALLGGSKSTKGHGEYACKCQRITSHFNHRGFREHAS